MAFRLRLDAQKWFSQIDGKAPIRTKFDLFYFCLLAGLMSGRRTDPAQGGRAAPEIVNNFVEDYRGVQRLIVGLLIVAELKKKGINLEEKDAVRKTIRSLVDPHTSTDLTDEGTRLLNAYASGGYEYISEQREAKPFSPEEFLRDFVVLINQAVASSDIWPVPETHAAAPAPENKRPN